MKNLTNSEKAIIDLFDLEYSKKISVREALTVGGEIALRSLIAQDKIYCSGTNTLSLVSIVFFGVNSYCNKIASIVDNKGYVYIDNLFLETKSNKRGYEVVSLLRSSGYIVNVVVKDLKASVTVFSERKYLYDADKSYRESSDINELEINKRVYKVIDKIGKRIKKAIKKGEFEIYYIDANLYKNDDEISKLIIKRLMANGYNINHKMSDDRFFSFILGVSYGVNISWRDAKSML